MLLETYDIFRWTVCVAGVVGAANWHQERPQARPQVCSLVVVHPETKFLPYPE
jgi:hypothetical protein